MKRFLIWLKKDPFVHSIVLFLSVPIIIFFVFFGIFIYSFAIMFHPDYEEFGPKITLYKAQDCADISHDYIKISDCVLLDFYMQSTWKNSPKTLNQVVESAVRVKAYDGNKPRVVQIILSTLWPPKSLPALESYPKKGNQWSCSKNGNIIEDNSKELARKSFYKCWPKQSF